MTCSLGELSYVVPMPDALTTAEIQALRIELHHFANRQTDPVVQSRCLTVVSMLGNAVERDDPVFRQDLANSIAQLEGTLRCTRSAISSDNTISIAPLVLANAKARFAHPIVISFRLGN